MLVAWQGLQKQCLHCHQGALDGDHSGVDDEFGIYLQSSLAPVYSVLHNVLIGETSLLGPGDKRCSGSAIAVRSRTACPG